MTLNLSQGAGQAIEDGLVLSRLLAAGPPAAAIAEFEQVRRERVSAMTRMAWRIGTLGCWHSDLSCRARDLFMRAAFSTVAERKTYELMMDIPF
jgi:2-polyprenyl-6-methoxyphenol hydroxylase-like FAD-dependent oxidoreductase